MRREVRRLVALVLLAGCAGSLRTEDLQVWVGRPAAGLRQEWGPATREVDDGDLRVLIYEQLERQSARDFTKHESNRYTSSIDRTVSTYQPTLGPATYVRSYLFWVDRAGTVVRSEARQP